MAHGIVDVARAAGVSTATVSRALRGLPNVTEATRDRVRRVAEELGYAPLPADLLGKVKTAITAIA